MRQEKCFLATQLQTNTQRLFRRLGSRSEKGSAFIGKLKTVQSSREWLPMSYCPGCKEKCHRSIAPTAEAGLKTPVYQWGAL